MSKGKFLAGFMLGTIAGGAASVLIQQNKRTIKGKLWRLKLRAQIDRKIGKLRKFSRAAYDEVVDEALEAYRERGMLPEAAFDAMEMELKRHWREAKARFEAASEEAREKAEEDEDDEDDE